MKLTNLWELSYDKGTMGNHFQTVRFATFRVFTLDYAPGERSARHTDRRPRISIVLNGQLREEVYGQEAFASAGSLVLKPGDAPHRNEYGPGPGRILTIDFNADPANAAFFSYLRDWRWLHGPRAAKPTLALLETIRHQPSEVDIREALVDLLGALPLEPPLEMTAAPDWLLRTEEQLQDTFDRSPRTGELARELDLHPVYLARVFRRYFGCSIKEYVQQIRLRRAMEQLAATQTSLAHVAFDNGYADQSHFTREFRRYLDRTPHYYRRLVRGYSL